MKKFMCVLLAVMLVMAFAVPVFADAGEKLKEGAKTFVMSPKNVCDSIKEEYEASEFKPFGVVGGLFKGIFYTGKDMATGLFDVLTFPVDFNK